MITAVPLEKKTSSTWLYTGRAMAQEAEARCRVAVRLCRVRQSGALDFEEFEAMCTLLCSRVAVHVSASAVFECVLPAAAS